MKCNIHQHLPQHVYGFCVEYISFKIFEVFKLLMMTKTPFLLMTKRHWIFRNVQIKINKRVFNRKCHKNEATRSTLIPQCDTTKYMESVISCRRKFSKKKISYMVYNTRSHYASTTLLKAQKRKMSAVPLEGWNVKLKWWLYLRKQSRNFE